MPIQTCCQHPDAGTYLVEAVVESGGATAGEGARFGLIVHHTDAEREYAYDRESSVGRLVRALDEAPARGWIVVDMKRDWRTIFTGDAQQGPSR